MPKKIVEQGNKLARKVSKQKALIRRSLLVITAIMIAGLFVFLANAQPDTRQIIAQATTHEPQPFTELYFQDYSHLPKSIEANKQYNSTFVLANHEAEDVSYIYKIQILQGGKELSAKQYEVQLPKNQSTSLPFGFMASAGGKDVEVIISIKDKPQSIHFRTAS